MSGIISLSYLKTIKHIWISCATLDDVTGKPVPNEQMAIVGTTRDELHIQLGDQ
jgi:hypothetical protein